MTITYTVDLENSTTIQFEMDIVLNDSEYKISSAIFGAPQWFAHVNLHLSAIKDAIKGGAVVEIVNHSNRTLREISTLEEYMEWAKGMAKIL